MSHPAWVCGLKHISFGKRNRRQVSHPAWVCGLKLKNIEYSKDKARHTLRGCVD